MPRELLSCVARPQLASAGSVGYPGRATRGPVSGARRRRSAAAGAWAQGRHPSEELRVSPHGRSHLGRERSSRAGRPPRRCLRLRSAGGREEARSFLVASSFAQGEEGSSLSFYTSSSIIIKFPVAVNLLKRI